MRHGKTVPHRNIIGPHRSEVNLTFGGGGATDLRAGERLRDRFVSRPHMQAVGYIPVR